jgi:hypothetical protein
MRRCLLRWRACKCFPFLFSLFGGDGSLYPFPSLLPFFSLLFPVQDINAFLGWLGLTLFSNRLVLVAVYCLMIAHPGFVFKKDRKDRSSAISQQELQEYNK